MREDVAGGAVGGNGPDSDPIPRKVTETDDQINIWWLCLGVIVSFAFMTVLMLVYGH